MPHTSTFRIYYEDTDSGGVVYYANYLKFAERARTETLRNRGINQSTLAQEHGILFVVRRANLDLFSPARLDDIIEVKTNITEISGASIRMLQNITCADKKIASVDVLVVCINQNFKPMRLPDNIRNLLKTSNIN